MDRICSERAPTIDGFSHRRISFISSREAPHVVAKDFEFVTRFSPGIRVVFRIAALDCLHIFRPRGDIISSDYRFAVFEREPSSLAPSIPPPPGETTDGCTNEADVGRRRGVRPPLHRGPRLGNRPDWDS